MRRLIATFLAAIVIVGAGATTASAEPYFDPGTSVIVSYNGTLVNGKVTGTDPGDDTLVSVSLKGIGTRLVPLSQVFYA
jgi:hypothetical protein